VSSLLSIAVTIQVGQLFREEDDILSVVCMIRVNIASALSFLYWIWIYSQEIDV